MQDIQQQQALPKLSFKVKNLSAYGQPQDDKNAHKKIINVGFSSKKQLDNDKNVKGPWPISPTPVTYKYHKQMDSTQGSFVKQLPHSIVFQPQKQSQFGKNNYFNPGNETKNKLHPRYLRQISVQGQEKQKKKSTASIIKPQNFALRKQGQDPNNSFEKEQFSYQFQKSRDTMRKSRKGQVNSQATHYRGHSQRKPNEKSLMSIKYTQEQFKQFCQQSRTKKGDITFSNKIQNNFFDQQTLPQKLSSTNEINQFKYNRMYSKRRKNRLHYHINAANEYKYCITPNSQNDKAQDSQLKKLNLLSRSPTIKNMKTVGKIIKTNKKNSEQLNNEKSSPQLKGNQHLQLAQEAQQQVEKSNVKSKVQQSPKIQRKLSKSPGKLTIDLQKSRTINNQKIENPQKSPNPNLKKSSLNPQPKLHKPEFILFQQPSEEEDNNFSLTTKLRKIKQLLIEAGQYLQIFFELPDILLCPPTKQDSRKILFQRMSQILKYMDLHTQIMKIKKYNNCAVLIYQKKKYQDQEKKQQDDDGINNLSIIWHYNGIVYIGGYKMLQDSLPTSQTSDIKLQEHIQKHGMGFEWHPTESIESESPQDEGYAYYGQYKQNSWQGYGILKKYTKELYIGLWQKGEKCGWGKQYNIKGELTNNGQFSDGKLLKETI